LITQQRYFQGGWRKSALSPAEVMTMSNRIDRSVDAVLDAYDELAPLGYKVMGRNLFPADLRQVEIAALQLVDNLGSSLSALELFVLTKFGGATVQGVHAELGRLAELGFFTLPNLDGIEKELSPCDVELTIVGEHLYGFHRGLGERRLCTGWAAINALAVYVHSGGSAVGDEHLRECYRLLRLVDLARPVTTVEISTLSYSIGGTFREAVDLYRQLFPETADFSMLSPALLESDLSFKRQHLTALLNLRALHYPQLELEWTLEAANLVDMAFDLHLNLADALDALRPFRKIGLPIPSLGPEDRERLVKYQVDVFDKAMLWNSGEEGDHWGTPVKSISRLCLVQIAGRFGWTPAQAYDRVSRFEPFGLVVDLSRDICDDSPVHWQDLLVLTVYLDGQEPALYGEVSSDHLLRAAKEIDETIGEVRKRLARFAPLFGFTLSAATDDGIPHHD
jgi:hypothetical protein